MFQTFDQLLDRLETAFVLEKNFSAGAAHGLKTPSLEEYAEVGAIVKHRTDRMKKLVDNLFAMRSLNGYEISEKVAIKN